MSTMTAREAKETSLMVQRAADILDHPGIRSLYFSLPSSRVARVVRDVVTRLKEHRRALTPDEVDGITHALRTAADYLDHPDVSSHHSALDAGIVAQRLRETAKRIKTLNTSHRGHVPWMGRKRKQP